MVEDLFVLHKKESPHLVKRRPPFSMEFSEVQLSFVIDFAGHLLSNDSIMTPGLRRKGLGVKLSFVPIPLPQPIAAAYIG